MTEHERCNTCNAMTEGHEPLNCQVRRQQGFCRFLETDVIHAIEQWLEYGKNSQDKPGGHKGYFSPGGWAYEMLKTHAGFLKNAMKGDYSTMLLRGVKFHIANGIPSCCGVCRCNIMTPKHLLDWDDTCVLLGRVVDPNERPKDCPLKGKVP